MSIVIVYGDQASGKTRLSAELMRYYDCTRIVDDWDGSSSLKNGDLALTTEYPPFPIPGAHVVDIQSAKQALCLGEGA